MHRLLLALLAITLAACIAAPRAWPRAVPGLPVEWAPRVLPGEIG